MIPSNVRFSDNPSADVARLMQEEGYSQLVVIVDANTRGNCYPKLASLPPHSLVTVPDGEEYKNLETCKDIWQQMTDLALDRHALVMVLGGGVLGDMSGFCAATYKRGIDFVLVPTTLLSLVDASIGGKLGIDFNNFKNHIGVFQQPVLTLLCSDFLSTLPASELRSGYAEVIKHVLISDASLWNRISSTPFPSMPWTELIKHSVEFKSKVTTEDPRERGLRKILNAGHTIGHAVETHFMAKGDRILHGEAIAIGLIAESYISYQRGVLSKIELDGIKKYIRSVFSPIPIDEVQANAISNLALQDKKNRDGEILCVLIGGIGTATWDNPITKHEIVSALEFYNL